MTATDEPAEPPVRRTHKHIVMKSVVSKLLLSI